ncbi:putative chaperonin subunit [Cryptosporidium canis]|uniref:Chaperonin subunit n=1 Tax=Cryptosporidium canis TaxID=195482 RepID=A0ABQ8PE51_9CRYT|nr:putative chaperonin subunit [Cryptosporidium canis]KAJ1615507.1 putative chaperonin subunit [Cryptosporidium canis]
MTNKFIKSFKPIFDRVLVQRLHPQKITKSGIILPESISKGGKNFFIAKVLSTGTGKFNQFTGEYLKCSVKPGDTVVVPEYGGIHVQQFSGDFDNTKPDMIVYKEDEILGTIESGELE